MNRMPYLLAVLLAGNLFADNLLQGPPLGGIPPAGLALRDRELVQAVTLPAGLFEVTVAARGQGELFLRAEGCGERVQALSKETGTYGYLFEATAGTIKIVVRVNGEATLTTAALAPATAEQQQAWTKQQDSMRQFGWAAFSAQRPSPGVAPLQFEGKVKPLAAMTRCAVLDEPRLNTAHSTNVERLVHWLGDNGFDRLDGEQLPAWMTERIRRGDAYGSVAVLPRGVSPVGLYAGAPGKPLWLEYLRAGGRIVHIGDMPFNYAESPVVAPVGVDAYAQGPVLLGLSYNWGSPYCGRGDAPVSPTPAFAAWGFETADGPVTGVPLENVSLAFHTYTAANGKTGACDWFRNVRTDMPWSGLLKLLQHFNGNNDAALRDVWRAAHYVGQPVVVPPLPPAPAPAPPAKLQIQTFAGGMTNRHEFVRGEKVSIRVAAAPELKADDIRVELVCSDAARRAFPVRPDERATNFTLDTAPLADGDYQLTVTALADSNTVAAARESIGIRELPPQDFHFEIWFGPGSNPLRTELELADIRKAGMEIHYGEPKVGGVDAFVRHHLGFSLRCMPDLKQVGGKEVTFEKNPEYFRLDNQGKPMQTAYSGGRPSLGISHPDMRAAATHAMEQGVRAVAGLPGFRPYVLCNDDFSAVYGWDYASHVLAEFKKDTGLDAPRKMELPPKRGPIPDNNPWVQWFEWTLRNVNGAYNKAETEGAVQARPDVRIGPIPGGMQIPLVQLWEPAQYPPYSFGPNGFNLIASYYYNSYWQPVMTDTFWMEIGRMGNRDLPEWNMPDVLFTGGYTRNNFYHYLAGGVRGLAYFMYPARTPDSWAEMHRLGKIARRIGPVQARLLPARRDIGLLNSFTSNCFDPGHTLVQVYAYHNLMQGHFSVEPVSEAEIVAGRAAQYKAIVLYNVQYLRQSVFDALARHAANGGVVLLDRTVPFDIPGAKRLAVDLGMGEQHTKPFPPEGAHVSTPGPHDYGHADRIATIQRAVAEYVKPQFDSTDIRLVATPFEAEGVPYTWFVNAQDGNEYTFCHERLVGYPKPRTPQSTQEVIDWEKAEMAKGPYQSTILMNSLPGAPYDLVEGKRLIVKKTKDHRYAVTVSMERFGGALVAWRPSPIAGLRIAAPRRVRPQETVSVTATIRNGGGALPVEFVLRDPRGRESVLSGVRVTTNNVARFEWTPAVNDVRGRWTVTAHELASGKSAVAKVQLK